MIFRRLIVLACASMAIASCSSSGDHDACKRFLGCVAEAEPERLESLLATYGSEGSCWTSSEIAAGCGEFCRARLKEAATASIRLEPSDDGLTFTRTYASCVECTADSQCADEARPGCHEAGICVQCTRDEHCQVPAKASGTSKASGTGDASDLFGDVITGGSSKDAPPAGEASTTVTGEGSSTVSESPDLPRERCQQATARCVECTADAHCTNPKYPRCDQTAGTCGGCGDDSDCPADKPSCAGGAGGSTPRATGPASLPNSWDAEVDGVGVAAVPRSGRSTCVECSTSAHCPADRSYCLGERCVECITSGQCTGNKQCVDGTCQQSCAEVMSCLRSECSNGCDPNPLCEMLQCKAAKELTQCIASSCTACFQDGFYSYGSYTNTFDCEGCIALSCAEHEQRCGSQTCEPVTSPSY